MQSGDTHGDFYILYVVTCDNSDRIIKRMCRYCGKISESRVKQWTKLNETKKNCECQHERHSQERCELLKGIKRCEIVVDDRKRLRSIYNGMKTRCYNPNHKAYRIYGGKGVKVCDEWLTGFKTFAEWAYSHGYRQGLTLDRLSSDGDYCPENCRWATYKEQGENRRRNNVKNNRKSKTT